MDASAPITPMPPVAPITEPVRAPAPDQTTTPQASIPEEFEALWREYPPRDGGNPKPTALKAWNARRKESHSAAEMRADVQRYAAWCAATGKLNTEYLPRRSEDNGHPDPDEAWGLLLRLANDERETGILTEEMRAGWQACQPIVELGDEVGARRCFLTVHARHVEDARQRNRPARWMVTLGKAFTPT